MNPTTGVRGVSQLNDVDHICEKSMSGLEETLRRRIIFTEVDDVENFRGSII